MSNPVIEELQRQYNTRDLYKLAKMLDISVHCSRRLNKETKGVYCRVCTAKVITINSNIPYPDRKDILAQLIEHGHKDADKKVIVI